MYCILAVQFPNKLNLPSLPTFIRNSQAFEAGESGKLFTLNLEPVSRESTVEPRGFAI